MDPKNEFDEFDTLLNFLAVKPEDEYLGEPVDISEFYKAYNLPNPSDEEYTESNYKTENTLAESLKNTEGNELESKIANIFNLTGFDAWNKIIKIRGEVENIHAHIKLDQRLNRHINHLLSDRSTLSKSYIEHAYLNNERNFHKVPNISRPVIPEKDYIKNNSKFNEINPPKSIFDVNYGDVNFDPLFNEVLDLKIAQKISILYYRGYEEPFTEKELNEMLKNRSELFKKSHKNTRYGYTSQLEHVNNFYSIGDEHLAKSSLLYTDDPLRYRDYNGPLVGSFKALKITPTEFKSLLNKEFKNYIRNAVSYFYDYLKHHDIQYFEHINIADLFYSLCELMDYTEFKCRVLSVRANYIRDSLDYSNVFNIMCWLLYKLQSSLEVEKCADSTQKHKINFTELTNKLYFGEYSFFKQSLGNLTKFYDRIKKEVKDYKYVIKSIKFSKRLPNVVDAKPFNMDVYEEPDPDDYINDDEVPRLATNKVDRREAKYARDRLEFLKYCKIPYFYLTSDYAEKFEFLARVFDVDLKTTTAFRRLKKIGSIYKKSKDTLDVCEFKKAVNNINKKYFKKRKYLIKHESWKLYAPINIMSINGRVTNLKMREIIFSIDRMDKIKKEFDNLNKLRSAYGAAFTYCKANPHKQNKRDLKNALKAVEKSINKILKIDSQIRAKHPCSDSEDGKFKSLIKRLTDMKEGIRCSGSVGSKLSKHKDELELRFKDLDFDNNALSVDVTKKARDSNLSLKNRLYNYVYSIVSPKTEGLNLKQLIFNYNSSYTGNDNFNSIYNILNYYNTSTFLALNRFKYYNRCKISTLNRDNLANYFVKLELNSDFSIKNP
ncbi:hypothetical protein HXS02_002080 [Campylobacter coli]|nr:hypothetical protein [Campylobacter coli]